MSKLKTFKVTTSAEGRFWSFTVIEGLPKDMSINYQTRRLNDVEQEAKELICEMLEIKESAIEIELEINLPIAVTKAMEASKKASKKETQAKADAVTARARVASILCEQQGLSRKEAATVLGINPSRVQQLVDKSRTLQNT